MVSTAMVIAGAQQWKLYSNRQMNTSSAQQMKLVTEAAGRYIKDNYAAVSALATPTTPALITLDMLRNTGYLPAGFADQNAFGQSYNVLAIEPTPNKLQSLVVTRNGDPINELSMIDIAKQIGAQGGYISTLNASVATGSFGGWSTSLAPYGGSTGSGHLASALFFEDGALVNDYLYRNAVPGHPEVNEMNTAINMKGNNLNNAGVVNAQTANISGNADIAGETYTGGWFRSRGDTGFYNEKHNGGWYMTDPGWVRSYADKGVLTGGEMRAGKLTSTGRAEVGEYLQLGGVAAENTACSPNGLLGRDASGMGLFCKDGLWKGSSVGKGKLVNAGFYMGTVTRTNPTSSPMLVTAFGGYGVGGTCTNVYQMTAAVWDGAWVVVGDTQQTYNLGVKSTFLSFMVPGGSSYTVSSAPYLCGQGQISLSEFTQ
ncbi:shufflon system plasmid conjugative transfer pilus tip adhesin PilV [Pseudomonas sp. MWU12-2115]|nr:shufflon system plasmid conjugative transfer pilus tip adhesin PilV [Pseudomonas sp. MWU12-2020]RBB97365.1 shufflon system plasmid conjugative transfer pilus tip adhesin PilV [Pseudomonas sp. MWU12-2115]